MRYIRTPSGLRQMSDNMISIASLAGLIGVFSFPLIGAAGHWLVKEILSWL